MSSDQSTVLYERDLTGHCKRNLSRECFVFALKHSNVYTRLAEMVIKEDNRAVLDLVGRQGLKTNSQYDDDEFLDKIAQKKDSFYSMPDKPSQSLDDVVGVPVEDEVIDIDGTAPQQQPRVLTAGEERAQQNFVAIFGKGNHKDLDMAAIPDTIQGNAHPPSQARSSYGALPEVGETEEERLAKQEDMERRQAYIMKYAQEQPNLKKEKSTRRKFLNIFDTAKAKE